MNSPNDLAFTDLAWTNRSCPPTRLSQPYMATGHNKPHEVTIKVAQMQSNKSFSFVPRGRPGQTMPAHPTDGSLLEDRNSASRTTLTPRLSYTSTPESPFFASNHLQDYSNEQNIVTRCDTTDGSGDFLAVAEKTMPAQYAEVRVNTHNPFKREFQQSPLDDWLSEPSRDHSWIESPCIQAAHKPQQPFSSNVQSFEPSTFSTHQILNNDPCLLSSHCLYAQHNNGMQQQTPIDVFGSAVSNDFFMLPRASNEVESPFHVDNHAFLAGFGPSSYNPHDPPFQGNLSDGNSASYPNVHHTNDYYFAYDPPQASNTLATQSDISSFTGQTLSKNRSRPKASDLDDLLIKWRAQGVTYKDIMKRGDWGLSESTLRGRYRTLTKDKRLRPRKPVWDNAALSALVTAVDHFAPSVASSTRTIDSGGKIPWKKVSEWMHSEKATHRYGFATIKKKYEQLVGDRQMQREVNQWRQANGEHPFTR